jgi:methionyl aminopeptidase
LAIKIKTPEEIKKMRAAGKLAARTLKYIEPFVKPGINTEKLNSLCHDYIIKNGAIPAPLNYRGYPKSICTSINNVVCHGIPSTKDILKEGDIINVDITVILDGYHGDVSKTYMVGKVSDETRLLVERTETALMKAIEVVKPGIYLNEIGDTIEEYISDFNYGIVREYTGHGIGNKFHEDPFVLHYHTDQKGPKLKEGMTFTIEPMINASPNWKTEVDRKDGWTVRTADGALSAQFEHTILVTENGHEILTKL